MPIIQKVDLTRRPMWASTVPIPGAFDMHGNVWEWASDWYATYSSGAVTDPEGRRRARTVSFGVVRGAVRARPFAFSLPQLQHQLQHRRHWLPCRFPADTCGCYQPRNANLRGCQHHAPARHTLGGPRVEAHDVRDGNITADITVSGTVDVNTTGTYTLTYTVSDAAGNEASITRTVNVVEGQASTHTAELNSTVSLEMIWVEPGTFTMGLEGYGQMMLNLNTKLRYPQVTF